MRVGFGVRTETADVWNRIQEALERGTGNASHAQRPSGEVWDVGDGGMILIPECLHSPGAPEGLKLST